MFSSAYPDIKLTYSSMSPSLSENIKEYLVIFNHLHKVLVDLFEKISSIHSMAANDLFSVVETCNKKIGEVTKGLTNSSSVSILGFLNQFLNHVENQAKSLKNLQISLHDTVVKPLRDVVCKKKEMWKTCFRYADTFAQQICKKETALQKCYKQYSDAAMKVKPGNAMEKQFQIFHDSHNTYLLKLVSVNSINNVFYTHVLPHIIHSIEVNHGELNNKYRHHISNLFYLQNDTLNKVVKFGDQMHNALDNLNILHDLQNFIKLSNENMKDKLPSVLKFSLPKVDQPKAGMFNKLESTFIISQRTRPNLQRRLASLQQQTQLLVDEISSRRSAETYNIDQIGDSSLEKLIDFLSICDKEANLNVLLKQMELYTPAVINFLGPLPHNLLLENKHSKGSMDESSCMISFPTGTRPHEFIEPRVMKPISCFYCEKLIVLIGKGYLCKVCKISVHKKCATSVKFCEPLLHLPKTPSAPPESIQGSPKSIAGTIKSSFVSDLIDLESDEDFYDQTEFDDFSEESDNGNDFTTRQDLYKSLSAQTSNVQNVNLLPEILNFNPAVCNDQPIYATLHETPPVKITNTVSDDKNVFVDLLPASPVYHQILPDEEISSEYSNASQISLKPSVAKKPLLVQKSDENGKPPIAMKPKCINSSEIVVKPSFTNTPTSDKPPIECTKPPLAKKPILDIKPPGIQKVSTQKNICVSLYDFHGTDTTHLSFLSGYKLEITEKSCDEWWLGEFNGDKGYFPSQYVLEIDEFDEIMRGLYDFSKDGERELSIEEGQILVLIDEGDDWLLVKSNAGEGLVPASYAEFI